MAESRGVSRRQFLSGGRGIRCSPSFRELAARELKRATIRDLQAMMLQGPGRTYTLVKVTADAGAVLGSPRRTARPASASRSRCSR